MNKIILHKLQDNIMYIKLEKWLKDYHKIIYISNCQNNLNKNIHTQSYSAMYIFHVSDMGHTYKTTSHIVSHGRTGCMNPLQLESMRNRFT
jgi:hypothetical protein